MVQSGSDSIAKTPLGIATGLPPFAWGILALIALRPSLDVIFASVTMQVGALNLSAGFLFNLLLVGLAAAIAVNAALVHRTPDRAVVTTLIIWAPMLVAAGIAAARSPVPAQALQVLFNYLSYAAVSLLALTWAPHIGRERLTMLIAASGVIPILTALFQAATGGAGTRVMGTFPHPNILAFFLLIYVAFLFHAQVSAYLQSAGARLVLWLPIALGLLALLLTGTRAGYAGMFVFLFLYAALRRPIYLIPLIILPPLALLVPGVLDRISDATSGPPVFTYDYLVSVARGDIADSGLCRGRFGDMASLPLGIGMAMGHEPSPARQRASVVPALFEPVLRAAAERRERGLRAQHLSPARVRGRRRPAARLPVDVYRVCLAERGQSPVRTRRADLRASPGARLCDRSRERQHPLLPVRQPFAVLRPVRDPRRRGG
ncbi:hypothetical protein QP181_16120 [Sphingomonas sp. LR55]